MYDLVVIGGGPAGTASAITAARSGARVRLFERGRFPRHKVCGEFVSAESLGLLQGLLAPQEAKLLSPALRLPAARIFVDGRVLPAEINPPAASISRFDLDAALWRSASHFGVEPCEQTVVRSLEGTGPCHVVTSNGRFEARSIINASGRWSNLAASNAQPQVSPEKWIGLKAHFFEPAPALSVDLYFFEGGYCGVQPISSGGADSAGQINVCAMVRAEAAAKLQNVFKLHPALRERSANWEPSTEAVSTSQLVFRTQQPVREGIFLAGDAAGFVDPFVGDGISLALRSGALAAHSLIPFFRGESSLDHSRLVYEREYETRLAPVFRSSSKIRRMLRMPRPLRRPVFSLLENAPAITRYLVRKTR